MATLKEKTANGLFWGIMSSGSSQLLNLVIGIFLARLLSPDEYGLLGMVAIFAAVAGCLQDSGFTTALINKKEVAALECNSVFWFNTCISVSLYIILFFAAPLIADFYHEPRLVSLSRLVFFPFIFAALGIVPQVMLTRALRVKESTIIGFIALLVSGIVGITLALNGYSYWSLAWQQVTFNFFILLGRYHYTRWHPTLQISWRPIREMFAFGSKILLTSLINILNNNILSLIFGRIYKERGAYVVGNYSQAYKWNSMASSLITSMVNQVAQPVMVSVRDDDERQVRVFRKMLRFTSFMAFPALFGLSLVSHEFILVTIKDEWLECADLLQILCIGGAFGCLHALYQNLVISLGKSGCYMWMNILQLTLNMLAVIVCIRWGISVVVAAVSAINILMLVPWQIYATKYAGLKWTEALKEICPFAVIAAIVMIFTGALTSSIDNPYTLLLLRIVVAATLYFVILRLLHAHILMECMGFIKEKLSDRLNNSR